MPPIPDLSASVSAAFGAILSEPDLLGEAGARLGIIGGDHGIVERQTPFLAILFWREIIVRTQMALERLEFLSVLETNNIVRRDGLAYRHSRLQFRCIGGLFRTTLRRRFQ